MLYRLFIEYKNERILLMLMLLSCLKYTLTSENKQQLKFIVKQTKFIVKNEYTYVSDKKKERVCDLMNYVYG